MSISALNKISNNTIYVNDLNVVNEANYRFLGASFTVPFNEVVAYPLTLTTNNGEQAVSEIATIPSLNGGIIELITNFSVQTTNFVPNGSFEYYFEYSINGGAFTEIAGYSKFLQHFSYADEIKNINISINIDEFQSNIGDELRFRIVVFNIDANEILVGEGGTVLLIRNWQKFL